MIFDRKNLNNNQLLELYKRLLWPRLIEEKMLFLFKQGRLGNWFSGIGQEAVAVGSALAMNNDEYILPAHRNLGVFTVRDVPLSRLMGQWEAKASGFTKGRDGSFQFGTQEYKFIGTKSHSGSQLAIANGIALADTLSDRKKATLVFIGEGAASQGDFHEALNLAAVWNLPVIFLVENNGYAMSTPVKQQYKAKHLVDRAAGYGMEGRQVDGNNLLEVYHAVNELATSMRENPRPVLLECLTFRMRGHDEASGNKYVSADLIDAWRQRDPLRNLEGYLLDEQVLRKEWLPQMHNEYTALIDAEIEKAFNEPDIVPDIAAELNDVYKPHHLTEILPKPSENKLYRDAINDALKLSMQQFDNLILMGQDIAEFGGAYKVTEELVEEFGPKRVRNTPLCESAVIGAAMGLAINGYKAVLEMQIADYISNGFNHVVNNLAKAYYRWEQPADVVIRMPTGVDAGAGSSSSQSTEAWFTKTPGLKVVYPAFADDAKGLLMSAIDDPNPVMFFEHKQLYNTLSGEVPGGDYYVPIGKARVVQKGTDATIVTYGLGVHWAIEYANRHPALSVEIIDLRSLQPWDKTAVAQSVMTTGRALILHEDTLTGGFGAEVAAYISEHCFDYLDVPVLRCASLDTPIPMNKGLEKQFLANTRLEETMHKLLNY